MKRKEEAGEWACDDVPVLGDEDRWGLGESYSGPRRRLADMQDPHQSFWRRLVLIGLIAACTVGFVQIVVTPDVRRLLNRDSLALTATLPERDVRTLQQVCRELVLTQLKRDVRYRACEETHADGTWQKSEGM